VPTLRVGANFALKNWPLGPLGDISAEKHISLSLKDIKVKDS
jgi:hypothetical protein